MTNNTDTKWRLFFDSASPKNIVMTKSSLAGEEVLETFEIDFFTIQNIVSVYQSPVATPFRYQATIPIRSTTPEPAMKTPQNEKLARIRASMMGGALGDCFGVAIEMKTFSTILTMVGRDGVTEWLPYEMGDRAEHGDGVITDDTCMTMATLAGLITAHNLRLSDPSKTVYQAYLRWGAEQEGALGLKDHFDKDVMLPDWFPPFCITSGAGKNTIGALNRGRMGTIEGGCVFQSLKTLKLVINDGCGGIMRVAPVAWVRALGMFDEIYATDLARRLTAITHGDDVSQETSAFVAFLIESLVRGNTWKNSSEEALKLYGTPRFVALLNECISPTAKGLSPDHRDHFVTVSSLPMSAYLSGALATPSYFSAGAVFLQVMYICTVAQFFTGTPLERMRKARTVAVTHGGDSDTVAAIVGNILGAQWGLECVEDDWKEHPLQSGEALTAAIDDLARLTKG